MRNRNHWYINHQIRSPKVRLIGENDEQIGVVTIKKALAESKNAGLDLVEVAPNAKPPVAKIIDFGKFKYQEEKKLTKQRKGSKKTEMKEVRFSPFIAKGDFETRIVRITEFLNEGNKIRIVVKFKGRQMNSKPFGYKLIEKVILKYKDRINIDMEPKFIGRHLTCVISPISKAKIKRNEEKEKKDNKNVETKDKKNTGKKV